MPIIKSAKKRVKQAAVRRKRNFSVRRKMKAAIKGFEELVKGKQMDEATKAVAGVYKAVDTAAKKGIIHKNNANRKKARIAKAVASK